MPFPAKTDAEAILDAAIEIVEQQSWDALSMRELGRKLGVRASSLYHHFTDRKELEAALGRRATQTLLSDLHVSANGIETGTSRILAVGEAYLRFARSNSALYPLVARTDDQQFWNWLVQQVALSTGNPEDPAATAAVWAFLHGFATLETAGQFGASGASQGFRSGLSALIQGLAKKEHIL